MRFALLSQEGSGIAKRDPTSREGGWFQSSQLSGLPPLEPPRRFAPPLLTQEGSAFVMSPRSYGAEQTKFFASSVLPVPEYFAS